MSMHNSGPQQSSPFAVAQGAPSSPQHTCPSVVVPHSRPTQHCAASVHGAVARRHIGPPSSELLPSIIVVDPSLVVVPVDVPVVPFMPVDVPIEVPVVVSSVVPLVPGPELLPVLDPVPAPVDPVEDVPVAVSEVDAPDVPPRSSKHPLSAIRQVTSFFIAPASGPGDHEDGDEDRGLWARVTASSMRTRAPRVTPAIAACSMRRAMGEPFKNLIDSEVVRSIGAHLLRADPKFARRDFEARALAGLAALELKARVLHVADALLAVLPTDVDRAAGLLEASLGPAGVGDDLSALRTSEHGLGGWAVWPLTEAIARLAIDAPERGLAALHAMTQRMTAEFAIRPLIVRHPALCFATFTRWTRDPSAHVRRLVSEGSRPRLPWGVRLQALVADPSPTLPLLSALQDDPSAYVRRSVANHLNDIAKDHPARIAAWLAEHLPGASAQRQALLKHASRTLIKQGEPAVLRAWGLGAAFVGQATWSVAPAHVTIGEALTLTLSLRSSSPRPQRLVIDYAMHHVKADGATSPKVFKGWTLELGPREARALTRQHSFKVITTRRYYPGQHTAELRINGQAMGAASFELRA